MPSCIVKGCNFSWKKKDPNVILHSFPGELGAIRSWLQATEQEFCDLDELCQKILVGKANGLYRMCSQHFTGDCYYRRGMLISLKKDALPTVFPDKEAIELKALRPKAYKPCKKRPAPPHPSWVNGVSTSIVMGLPMKLEEDASVSLSKPCYISEQGYNVPHGQRRPWDIDLSVGASLEVLPLPKKSRTHGTNTEYFPSQRHKATLTDKNMGAKHKEVQTENSKYGQQLYWCGEDQSSLASHLHPGKRTSSSVSITPSNTLRSHSGSSSESPKIPKAEILDVGCSCSWPALGDSDIEMNPRLGSCSSSSAEQELRVKDERSGELGIKSEHLAKVEIADTSSDPDTENKYVVFDSCLNKLLLCCRCLADVNCNGSVVKFKKFFVGSSVSVKAKCSNGHRFHLWDSQPL